METWQVPFPSWKTIVPQVALFFVMEDAWHYFCSSYHVVFELTSLVLTAHLPTAHQALHYGPLYRNIHKLHHRYSAPFGLAAEFAHPFEIIILGMGTVGGPLLYCYLTHNLHILTVYIWIVLRLFQAVDAHSGYDFPWSLHHIFPLWSGADHHDFHHMAFTNVSYDILEPNIPFRPLSAYDLTNHSASCRITPPLSDILTSSSARTINTEHTRPVS